MVTWAKQSVVKIIVVLVIILFVAIGSLLTYVKVALPRVGDAPEIKIKTTSERLERGKYLVTHVAVCIDCHSVRDWSKLAGPINHGTLGSGGERFDQTMGLPGVYYSPNITPFNLKNWTDGEIFRTITTGVTKDGKALFPIMPYPHYAQMDKEDIYSIIAYIRTLPAVETKNYPASKSDFPMNFIINTIPKEASLKPIPSANDQIAYGRYLINAASCSECHTKMEKGEPLPGMEFAGGAQFKLPDATITSANITPDKETGIGNWTKELFVKRFKAYADSSFKPHTLAKGEFQTVMPWIMFAGMTESDLEAIYAYLKTVKPVKNQVVKFESKHNYTAE